VLSVINKTQVVYGYIIAE